jgi:hypothetical protein
MQTLKGISPRLLRGHAKALSSPVFLGANQGAYRYYPGAIEQPNIALFLYAFEH